MIEEQNIGRVFTPIEWSIWLLERMDALNYWRDGATICDPTFGGGSFVIALLELAKRDNLEITRDLISRIYGCEVNPNDKSKLIRYVEEKYDISLDEGNFTTGDVLSEDYNKKFDILVGNPPWANFSALPESCRNAWGNKYIEYGLVKSKKSVLLGGSRADIATLILKKILDKNIKDDGIAAFFVPLSIFFNSGSNDLFRPYPGSDHGYSVDELWDFSDEKVFSGVATRYGVARIRKSGTQKWPVITHVRTSGDWRSAVTMPSDGKQGFWQRHEIGEDENFCKPKIAVTEDQKPRQGLNTCGANNVFILTKDGDYFKNSNGEVVDVEEELMMPLMDRSIFSGASAVPRYILVAHNKKTGRPFTDKELNLFPKAKEYLFKFRYELMNRKGTMLKSYVGKGQWWSLLGVGPYSFSQWKVAWEALGKSAFKPVVVSGEWQGNQALHAYCPCNSKEDAWRLSEALREPAVEKYLLASAMGGTMNWAQPGRVAKLFVTESAQSELFV